MKTERDFSRGQHKTFSNLFASMCDCLVHLGPDLRLLEPCQSLSTLLDRSRPGLGSVGPGHHVLGAAAIWTGSAVRDGQPTKTHRSCCIYHALGILYHVPPQPFARCHKRCTFRTSILLQRERRRPTVMSPAYLESKRISTGRPDWSEMAYRNACAIADSSAVLFVGFSAPRKSASCCSLTTTFPLLL